MNRQVGAYGILSLTMLKNKALIVTGVIVLLLVITNPSLTAFKENQGASSYKGLFKKYNFFVFSIYHNDHDYVGVIGNFFSIKPARIRYVDSAVVDSMKVDTTLRSNNTKSDTTSLMIDTEGSSSNKKANEFFHYSKKQIDSELNQFMKDEAKKEHSK